MFHSVSLLSQAPSARGSRALPSVLLLLLIDTVPGDIDIGDNDCDTVSEEATPTSSVVSPATSSLPGCEGRQVEKGNRRTRGQGRGRGRGHGRGRGRGQGSGRGRGRGRGIGRGGRGGVHGRNRRIVVSSSCSRRRATGSSITVTPTVACNGFIIAPVA